MFVEIERFYIAHFLSLVGNIVIGMDIHGSHGEAKQYRQCFLRSATVSYIKNIISGFYELSIIGGNLVLI